MYLGTFQFDDLAAKIKDALKDVAPDAQPHPVVKFHGDSDKVEAAKKALENAGFKIVEVEKES